MFEYVLNSPVASEDSVALQPGDFGYCRQPVEFQHESMPVVGSMIKQGYPWITVTLPQGAIAQGHDLSGLSFLMHKPSRELSPSDVVDCEIPSVKVHRGTGRVEQLNIKMFTCDERGQMTGTVEVSTTLLASACRRVAEPEADRARALELSRDRAAAAKYSILAATPDKDAVFNAAGITVDNQPAWTPPARGERASKAGWRPNGVADKYGHGEPRCGALTSAKADAMFSRAQAEFAPKTVAASSMGAGGATTLKQVINR